MRLDKITGTLGTTVYLDGELIAEDVAVTLPPVTFAETEIQGGGGSITVPLYPLPQNLEASITFRGQSEGFAAALASAGKQVEVRWAVSQLQPDQTSRVVGMKAFLTGLPRSLPGPSVGVGEAEELEVAWTVTRYQLVRDGATVLLIDKLAGKVEIDGQDYASDLSALL